MGGEVDAVLGIVVRARRRLVLAAMAEAAAAPAAGFLLVAAAVLAAARATGRADLPVRLLGIAALFAALAASARLLRAFPGPGEAALHLDRALGAEERFVTVLETAEGDAALAAWAARGALARAAAGDLRRALALRPPAALLPLLLAATVASGLALLPAPPPAAAAGGEGGTVPVGTTGPAGAGAGVRAGAPGAAPAGSALAVPAANARDPEDDHAMLRELEARAREVRSGEALRAAAAARAALDRGDRSGAEEAVRRALGALGVGPGAAPAGGTGVPGASAGGSPAAGPGSLASGTGESFRPLAVPLRAREAVKRYYGSGD